MPLIDRKNVFVSKGFGLVRQRYPGVTLVQSPDDFRGERVIWFGAQVWEPLEFAHRIYARRETVMPGISGSRKSIAVLVVLLLFLAAPFSSPAFSDQGNVGLYVVLDSPELLGSIDGDPDLAPDTAVLFEAFNPTSGELVRETSATAGAGLADAFLLLPDGSYKIRATAEGFQESWYTVPSGQDGGAFEELLTFQERHTFETADVIVVDSVNPDNASWNAQGWTVLHPTVSSISGAVASNSTGEPGTLLEGVAVELFDAAATSESAHVAVTSTGPNGYYTFKNQVPGSYKVRFTYGTSKRWWPETEHIAEAEVITLDGASHFNFAYAIFRPRVDVDPSRQLNLSGDPALGAVITAAPDFVDGGDMGLDCLQRYTWFLGTEPVVNGFGPTFAIPLDAGATTVSARLDIAGIGCTYTALASDPIDVEPGLTLPGTAYVAPVDNQGGTDITIRFDSVTTAGTTTVTRLDSGDQFPDGGFSSLTNPPLYYDIETSAGFDAVLGAEVCITFDTTGMTEGQAAGQHLYHYVDGVWADITVRTAIGEVCGVTHSFSPFAVGQPHWPFGGFLQPVDNGGILNAMKAGAAVPIKFGLDGSRGLDILTAGAPSSSVIACPGGTQPDNIEQTLAAGTNSLSYDAVSDTYTFVWKTGKTWAGSCRQFELRLNDGTLHTALFEFRK